MVAVFSVTQANRGRDTFRARCTECHTSTEFNDSAFKYKWNRRTAGDLYEFIATSMPDHAPASLTPAQSVDIVTYIMQMNDFETGPRELPADPTRLDRINLSATFGCSLPRCRAMPVLWESLPDRGRMGRFVRVDRRTCRR